MAAECWVDARLGELIAPPIDVIGPWKEQWRARIGAHAAAKTTGLIPWRWPCGVSRGKGPTLLRDRPWTVAFQARLEDMLKVKINDRDGIASLLLPQKVLDWAAARPSERPWALRVDIVGNRLHWCFAFYEGRVQHAFGRRWLEPSSGQAYHDLLWRRSNEGFISTLSEHLFAAVLPLYDRLGIERIDLTASLAAGGALWPAFGAVPRDDLSWQRLSKQIRSRLRRQPAAVQAEVRDRIERHLAAGGHAVLDIRNERAEIDPPGSRLGRRLLEGTRYDAVIRLEGPTTRVILEKRIRKLYDS